MKRRFGIVLAAAVALGLSLPTAAAQAAPVAVSPNYLAAGDSITTGLGVSSAQAFPSRLDAASRKLTLANVATPGAGLAAVGAQLALYTLIAALLKEAGRDDVLLFCGGTIPAEDRPVLEAAGYAGVFGPDTPLEEIVSFVRDKAPKRGAR